MRAFKIIVICGMVLFLAAALSAGYILFLRPSTLPVYHMEQKAPDGSSFPATTLTLGDQVYISDKTEVPLEILATWVGAHRMIGRTEDGMDVYAIPQQDPRNYIMLTTLMFPRMIFRNTHLPPIQLSSFPFDELQWVHPQSAMTSMSKTRESAIIKEVTTSLVRREGSTKVGEAIPSTKIYLTSGQLPGLAYTISAYATIDGKVFLVEGFNPEEWIPAGPNFTNWFQQLPIKSVN